VAIAFVAATGRLAGTPRLVMKMLGIKLSLLVFLFFASTAEAASLSWAGLWQTPDQRGEQLLQQGNAKAAAQIFSDPRRKAFAELKAGDYAAAAKSFSAFDDSDSHYNRGNALAHAGDLEGALNAYNEALARNPKNSDARQNREAVAKELEKKPPQEKSSSQQSSSQQPPSSSSSQKQSGQQSGEPLQNQTQKKPSAPGNESQKAGGENNKSNSSNPPRASGKQPDESNTASNNTAQNSSAKNQSDAQKNSVKNSASTATQENNQQSEQSQNPQEKSVQQAQQHTQSSTTKTTAGKAGFQPDQQQLSAQQSTRKNQSAATPRLTEKQLEEQQWLRNIPDDPGNLLRNKFRIEYELRQRQSQP
jgi:Ca-activated chloride channel family protein